MVRGALAPNYPTAKLWPSRLVELCEKHGSLVKEGIRINLRLTRQDIADIVGTTVETAIMVMSKFRKQGILTTDSKHIVVISKEKLGRLIVN